MDVQRYNHRINFFFHDLAPQSKEFGNDFSLKKIFLFPNQFAYIADYYEAEITDAIGTESILNIPAKRVKFYDVIDVVDTQFIDKNIQLMKHSFNYDARDPIQMWFDYMEIHYRLKTGKVVNRKTFVIDRDENNRMLKTMSICTDVTHLGARYSITPRLFTKGKVIDIRIDPLMYSQFTPREKQVILFLRQGYTSNKMASILQLSKHTIDEYRRKILEKTGCSNTFELLHYYHDIYLDKT